MVNRNVGLDVFAIATLRIDAARSVATNLDVFRVDATFRINAVSAVVVDRNHSGFDAVEGDRLIASFLIDTVLPVFANIGRFRLRGSNAFAGCRREYGVDRNVPLRVNAVLGVLGNRGSPNFNVSADRVDAVPLIFADSRVVDGNLAFIRLDAVFGVLGNRSAKEFDGSVWFVKRVNNASCGAGNRRIDDLRVNRSANAVERSSLLAFQAFDLRILNGNRFTVRAVHRESQSVKARVRNRRISNVDVGERFASLDQVNAISVIRVRSLAHRNRRGLKRNLRQLIRREIRICDNTAVDVADTQAIEGDVVAFVVSQILSNFGTVFINGNRGCFVKVFANGKRGIRIRSATDGELAANSDTVL